MSNGKRIVLAAAVVLTVAAGVGVGWVVRGPGDQPAPVEAVDAKVLARCREAVEEAREGFALAAEAEKTDEEGRRAERTGGDVFEVVSRRSKTSAEQRSVLRRFDVAAVLCER